MRRARLARSSSGSASTPWSQEKAANCCSWRSAQLRRWPAKPVPDPRGGAAPGIPARGGGRTGDRDPVGITPEPLGEPLDEPERLVGSLTPAAVDDQRVAVAGDLLDLGHARVVLLLLVGGVDDRRRDGVVPLAGDKQQRATVGVLGVDLVLGPGIQIGQ